MSEIGIESTLVEAIKNGDKTIEARLGKPRYLLIQEDDIMSVREDFLYEGEVLESLSHAIEIKITQVLYFETFKELFDAVDFQAVLPSAKTVDEAVKTYKTLYPSEEESEFGVVAFAFELVEK
ncbi:MAG TPA: ASCH domain-containing protein [Candidatus Microsaccharimonas sp.]|jgi:ASC-1-like (ASCH) protein